MKPIEELTDQELSEAVAVECAGYAYYEFTRACGSTFFQLLAPGDVAGCLRSCPSGRKIDRPEDPGEETRNCPPFATSADAVLALLETHESFDAFYTTEYPAKKRWRVTVHCFTEEYDGYAPTFARAAALALLKARRAQG